MGAACRWWLHQSLASLDRAMEKSGNCLTIRKGDYFLSLQNIIRETGATAVFWNRCYDPSFRIIDRQIVENLKEMNVSVHTFNGSLLFDPENTTNKAGKPYQVFTPFWRACLGGPTPDKPLPVPALPRSPIKMSNSVPLDSLKLEPQIDWTAGIRSTWNPGEEAVTKHFRNFLEYDLLKYDETRDRPDLNRGSRLSPHLHFGEISIRQIWHDVHSQLTTEHKRAMHRNARSFLRQLGWREFAYHLLYHFPHSTLRPLRAEYECFPWTENSSALKAWQRGKTGYPLIDAGMRELWTTGWMHNRVRMVTASFLVKHLVISWQEGAEWFWDTLVDADLANNTLGWQWVAGCGADAAPYFRIFNPMTQGIKFDPNGDYVRRWVPELARLPAPWIHKPWEAPPLLLKECGIVLGKTYPNPIVDHQQARERALQLFYSWKSISGQIKSSSMNRSGGRRGSRWMTGTAS